MTLSTTAQALLRMLPFVLCACQVLLAVVQQLFLRTRNCQLIHFQHMWSSPVSTSSAAESSTCPTGPADYSRQSNGRQFVPQCAEGCVSDDKYKSSVYGSLAYAQVYLPTQQVLAYSELVSKIQIIPVSHCAYRITVCMHL